MARPPDNVVLTGPAAEALRAQFLGWQCRLRQLAVRQDGGRPSAGMRPRVTTLTGEQLAAGVITLISELEPENSTQLFRYQYLKTQDPNERYDRVLEILQGSYFQEPARFADVLTALFGPGSALAGRLSELGRCVLDFEQHTQAYRIPCSVVHLPPAHSRYEATYWHNRMFNPDLPAAVEILAFAPDWTHASGGRSDRAQNLR